MADEMRIRMRTSFVGDDLEGNEFVAQEGEEHTVSKEFGRLLCEQPAEAPRAEPVGQTAAQRRQTRPSAQQQRAEER